ncbi:thiamine-phosphate kinase [Nocardioides terrisoli]|uniref:thiamine-phosphate kinase n=1 Tax=Nocardioides terrisoli TaxID=3388267 RepID=UPI00287B6B0E|nr:thiamine-phosphate kinase [Nocardioides marmorisolisilvae]
MAAPADLPAGATLADVGEFGLIRALTSRFEQGPLVYVGPGDDAALLRAPKGHVVVSTDLLVEGRHFRREWSGAHDIGRRAAAQNLSDINAMGGTPTALTVGLAAPPSLAAEWLLDLAEGIAEEAALVGASVIGGDLTAADEVVVAITVLGSCEVAPVLRSGARPGDVLALAGRQGWSAAGLAVLKRGFRSPRVLVEAHQRPQPPYAAGPAAARAGATSMIDVSDGLVADVGHLAEDSGVAIDVHRGAFDLAEPMIAVGAALGVDSMQFVLGGGEDHAIAATFPAGTDLPEDFVLIGEVHEGAGVTVDGATYDGPAGHTHF